MNSIWRQFKKPEIFFPFLAFLLCAIYAYFLYHRLGIRPFYEWDEAIYAQVAKETLLNRSWFSFTFFGHLWFEKPPLIIWLTALGYKLFGINELGGRFFIPLFSLATVPLTYLFTLRLRKSHFAALLSVLFYCICSQFFFQSYFLEYDTVVGFFIVLALYAFLLAEDKPNYFYLFGSAVGLGVLTKSVIGLLPLPILLLYCLAARKWGFLKIKQFWYGVLVGLAIVIPWHVIETIKYGAAFWNNYLVYHVLDRYAKPLENNGGPFLYYLPVFTQDKVYAFFTALSGCYFAFRVWSRRQYALPLLAAAFIFLFFSLSQTKGYAYIVVIHPFLMVMFGITLADILSWSSNQKIKILATLALAGVFLALAFQENNFKILRLESISGYSDDRDIAGFLNAHYPGKTVYGQNDLTFAFYLGRQITDLPDPTILPSDFDTSTNSGFQAAARYRVFHRKGKSVYNFNDFIYIAP